MHLLELVEILSPRDVVVLTVETKEVIKRSEINDQKLASLLLHKAEKLVFAGEFPTENPTYRNMTNGIAKEEVTDWRDNLINELSKSKMKMKVQQLDNTKDVVEVSCEVYMIAHNCKQLNKQLLKEVKCARAHTTFGPIAAEL